MKYLELLQKFGIKPNFWCSEEYWKHAHWREVGLKVCSWVEDGKYNTMLPPIFNNGFIATQSPFWAGFAGMEKMGKRLDYEFIYKPISDLGDLPGKQWHTTRKNIHKTQREHGMLAMRSTLPSDIEVIGEIMEEWVKENEIEILEDADVMYKFVMEGENRITLMIKDKIVGLIIFDENFKYINFRYCIVQPWPGLSDYARMLFHKAVFYRYPGMLINDGGCLDREDLFKYKKRLCPIEINSIWSTL
jgi:hypothetical protein